jgi:hypothetical protein
LKEDTLEEIGELSFNDDNISLRSSVKGDHWPQKIKSKNIINLTHLDHISINPLLLDHQNIEERKFMEEFEEARK